MSNREGYNHSGAPVMPEGKTPLEGRVFLPGATLGILGSGQLGRMMAMAAKSLGYRVVVYDAAPNGPACSSADLSITASFHDQQALAQFAAAVDVVTVEFENIPLAALEFLEKSVPVRPSSSVVGICQDRVLEKEFLHAQGIPVAPFRLIFSAAELKAGMRDLAVAAILKTTELGYDGKGQVRILPEDDLESAWARLDSPRAVLEQSIPFVSEASVICARSPSGEVACFPIQENIHCNGILDVTIAPAALDPTVAQKAEQMALSITEKLGVVGLMTVEFFVLTDGSFIVNELAPRPHNSGHHTLETVMTSQFTQHIRAICGLPLGSVKMRSPGVMLNLLGDLWRGGEPDWAVLLREEDLFLHLYGKSEAKLGRKMGHFTLLGADDALRERALHLRTAIITHSV
jgi:5-(carboxyamino)imidazole ribonucleotide synthase